MRPSIPLERFEVFADGLDHPEGLAFDREGNLWAGGELGQVYKIDQRGRAKEITCVGGFNLGVTISPRQDIFLCNLKKHSLIQVDRKGTVLRSWERAGNYRFRTPNFSVFDSEGNLYFSDSGEWQQDDGHVLVLRPNGRVELFAGPFAFPNGLSLSADERTLYVVESTRDALSAVPIRRDGTAGKPRTFARGLARVPDGCGLDSKGNLYVTCYASHNVYKVSPSGKVSLIAEDPFGTMIASPTNVAFAGDYMYFANLSRWHICRVRAGVKGQQLAGER
ncbi:MAG TPA: SMP-30/gluconolactonase/LRE family protein [Terriglobales bacterium]